MNNVKNDGKKYLINLKVYVFLLLCVIKKQGNKIMVGLSEDEKLFEHH